RGDREERHLSSVVNFVRWVQGQQPIYVGPTRKEEWDPVFLLSQTRRHVVTWAQIVDRIMRAKAGQGYPFVPLLLFPSPVVPSNPRTTHWAPYSIRYVYVPYAYFFLLICILCG
ncbi:hypothetical protein PanWU01x14_364330, partial [Parasponia andersonii]